MVQPIKNPTLVGFFMGVDFAIDFLQAYFSTGVFGWLPHSAQEP